MILVFDPAAQVPDKNLPPPNGLVNFCSVNNGTEFNNTHRYLGPNHYTKYTRVLVPKKHPPDNVITTYGGGLPKPGQIRENYSCCSSSDEFGIF